MQRELDRAVSRMVPWRKELTKTHGAGRTDKGVHATGQVIHFDLPRVHRTTGEDMEPLSPSTVKEALNFHLTACEAHEVRVVDAQVVDKSFHARHSAVQRHYGYRVLNDPSYEASVFEDMRSWHMRKPLDVDAMRAGAEYLVGRHDFTSFRSSGCRAASPVRKITDLSITRSASLDPWSRDQHVINISVSAEAFLYNQVRRIVGVLVDVGRGKLAVEQVREILEARDNTCVPVIAPPQGLYFRKVDYD